ncbi:hypothetical protein [Halobacillus faecis]
MKCFLYGGIILANIHAVRGPTENMVLMFFVSAPVIALLDAFIKGRRNPYF